MKDDKKTTRAKVRCLRILSSALVPVPVIVATLGKTSYVYLEYEMRHALTSELFRPCGWSEERGGPGFGTLRGHCIDAETGAYHASPSASWLNAEGSWVEVHPERYGFVIMALDGLRIYRQRNRPRAGQIDAPSWRALTACRVLAIAAGCPDPYVPEGAR